MYIFVPQWILVLPNHSFIHSFKSQKNSECIHHKNIVKFRWHIPSHFPTLMKWESKNKNKNLNHFFNRKYAAFKWCNLVQKSHLFIHHDSFNWNANVIFIHHSFERQKWILGKPSHERQLSCQPRPMTLSSSKAAHMLLLPKLLTKLVQCKLLLIMIGR